MAVTRTIRHSLPSRLGKSISGVLGGLALMLVAIVLLSWNEKRAVATARGLAEGEAILVTLDSVDAVDRQSDGQLVHLSGTANSTDVLRDDLFGIEIPALKLRRNVEMLQWREKSETKTQTKLGGGTETVVTYSYEKTWSDSLINSSAFQNLEGHQNPATMPVESTEFIASAIHVGAYRLGPGLVEKLDHFEEIPPPADLPEGHVVQGNVIFRSADINAPQIGDLRITLKAAMPAEISIVARNQAGTLDGFRTSTNSVIQMLQYGRVDAADMFRSAKSANKSLTFGLRILGFLLLFIGVKSVLGPVAIVADMLPILGKVTRAGTTILSALIALPVAFITIAIAWLAYRPLVGSSLLVVAAIIAVAIILVARKKATVRPAVSA